MNREEIKKILPHREPMLLIDEASLEDGRAVAKYRVRGDEFFLQGHFPGFPIVPGVIQCEMMAQASCVLFPGLNEEKLPIYAGIENVRFRGMIGVGDELTVTVSIKKEAHPLYKLYGEIFVNGKRCTCGTISVALYEKDKRN